MANFLGWKRDTLENFYIWQGYDDSPAQGTVNELLGYDSAKTTRRYTMPHIHKDSTCDRDSFGLPIEGTIQGAVTDVLFVIDDECPIAQRPSGLLTQEQVDLLDWFSETEE